MKVYVLENWVSYEGLYTYEIFLDKEKAEKECEKRNKNNPSPKYEPWDVVEMEVK